MKGIRIKWHAGVLLAIFLQLMLLAGSAQADYGWSWDDTITVTANDGVLLSANLFTPQETYDGETFPAILMPNSWLMEEHEYFAQALTLCKKGYLVLSYSVRGWGTSGGMVNVGGEKDMADIRSMVDWIVANTPVAGVERNDDGDVVSDDGVLLGMCGISLGGGLSVLGAAHDTRIKAVMAMVPWGDLQDALYLGQSPKTVWHKGMLIGGGHLMATMDPELDEVTDMLFNHQHDNLEYILGWALSRSPINYLDAYNDPNRDLAICLSNNLQDELFTPNQIIPFFESITCTKRLDLNLGIHPSAELGGLAGLPNAVWDNVYDWFDTHLKGEETGIMDRKIFSIQDKRTGERYYMDDLASATEEETYYLGYRPWYRLYGKLAASSQETSSTNTIKSGPLSGAMLGIPILSPFLEAHTRIFNVTASMPLINKYRAAIFTTERFTEDRTILGTPTMDLKITPTNDRVQLIGHLYAVNDFGIGTLITHAPLTLLEYDSLMPAAVPGEPVRVSMEFISTAYTVPKGYRVMLVIDTEDMAYAKPSDDSFRITFGYDDETRLNLPFKK